jgi:hypothetical protein
MISFACPACSKRYKVTEEYCGRKTKCANCQSEITIPSLSSSAVKSSFDESHASASAIGSRRLDSTDESGGNYLRFLYFCLGFLFLAVAGFFVWIALFQDDWEYENLARVSGEISSAIEKEKLDPLGSYKVYAAILGEAQTHAITIPELEETLKKASERRSALEPVVSLNLAKEAAAKKRQEEDQARRLAAEEAKIADEQRQLAAAEAARIEEEKRRVEEQDRLESIADRYEQIPRIAHNAIEALRRIEARVEVGVNYTDYSELVGNTWAEVKPFLQSKQGEELEELRLAFAEAIIAHKLALDIWRNKIEFDSLYGDEAEVNLHQQKCWVAASAWTELAGSLIDETDKITALEECSSLRDNAPKLEDEWNIIQKKILNR